MPGKLMDLLCHSQSLTIIQTPLHVRPPLRHLTHHGEQSLGLTAALKRKNTAVGDVSQFYVYCLATIASRLEAIAIGLEAIASRLEAIAIAIRLEAIATRLEGIANVVY